MQRIALLIGVVSHLVACGGGGNTDPDARPRADATMQIERAYVVKRIVLASTVEQVEASQFVFPGSGVPVNKVGALVQVMLGLLEGIPVQADLDANILAGLARQVAVIRSAPLDGFDDQVTGYLVNATDVDDPADPTNDFNGAGQFRLAAGVATDPHWTTGSIDGGELVAHGNAESSITIEIPLFAEDPAAGVPGVYAQTRGTITEEGFVGAAASAITRAELEATVYPVTARLLTMGLQLPVARAEDISNLFDTNKDGMVTVEELIANPTMATLTSEDMDLDGDTVNDHISQGILIETVRVELVP
ncbi:MAG TPA: hypothetical protein VML75_04455 [Kofleriaceae bacterium]|nr:hypothetical protein [Kofleriaceae bacterium]